MVRLDYTFDGDAFADGHGEDKFLIDLSEGLSQLYSRKIAQANLQDSSSRVSDGQSEYSATG